MIKPEGLAGIAEDEQIWLLRVFSLGSAESNLTGGKLSHNDDGKSLRVKYYFLSFFSSARGRAKTSLAARCQQRTLCSSSTRRVMAGRNSGRGCLNVKKELDEETSAFRPFQALLVCKEIK